MELFSWELNWKLLSEADLYHRLYTWK
jgi:hypothetical protein